MPFDTNALRETIRLFCGDSLGIAVSKNWLELLLQNKLSKFFAWSSQPWKSHDPDIFITPKLPILPTLKLEKDIVYFAQFSVELHLQVPQSPGMIIYEYDPSRVVSIIRFTFAGLAGKLKASSSEITLDYIGINNLDSTRDPSESRENLLVAVGKSEFDMAVSEAAIRQYNGEAIAKSIVSTFRFPELLKTVLAFDFYGELDILSFEAQNDEFVLLRGTSGSRLVSPDCPNKKAQQEIHVELGGATANGKKSVDISFEPQVLQVWSEADIATINEKRAEYYLYIPEKALRATLAFDPPAVEPYEGKGEGGPVVWDYSVKIDAGAIQFEMDLKQPHITLASTIEIVGRASAAVNVLCVTVPLGDGELKAKIETEVKVYPQYKDKLKAISFNAVISKLRVIDDDIEIDSILLIWPLEEIVESILETIFEAIVPSMVGKIVNVGRFELASLVGLGTLSERLDFFTFSQSASGLLLGITKRNSEGADPRPKNVKLDLKELDERTESSNV